MLSIGTTVHISASLPSTINLAGFQALSYTQIRGCRVASNLGKKFITFVNNPIGGVKHNVKSGLDVRSLGLDVYKLPSDAGQVLLDQALESENEYSIKIVEPDGLVNYSTACITENTKSLGADSPLIIKRYNVDIHEQL